MWVCFRSSIRSGCVFGFVAIAACGGVSNGKDLFGDSPRDDAVARSGRAGGGQGGTSAGEGAGGAHAGRAGDAPIAGSDDDAGAAGDAGATAGQLGHGGVAGLGGTSGRGGNANGGALGGASEPGAGGEPSGPDCNAMIEELGELLAAAAECRVDVDRMTCVGVVTDPCGCTHAVDRPNARTTAAYEAAVAALMQQCVVYCPARECPKITKGTCEPDGTSVFGRCVAAATAAD